ncbi:hypothetical protein [Glaciecola petra]|uniref:DNA repair ATPase n=1 Tax=Glaciecola petra TaxID=3075602 RepID=A0ABU2ZP58_9ALTE|nr:hypothetical protein [Aestuariibacter sp. P117]MDT0594405.1 hypothetical protein [Aestuariibacter sp. P117]
MTYTIIIILITFLIVCGIAATAVQQHNEKKEKQKREEVSLHKTIFEETEEAFLAAIKMPLSQLTLLILRKRSIRALKVMHEYNPTPDIVTKLDELTKSLKGIDASATPPNQESFQLPAADKVIIKYIQAVKKIRNILRNENNKGKIPPNVFAREEKAIECLQLRVNVETLTKRANDAVASKMQGSARQYIEKAIKALVAHKPKSEYSKRRKEELESMLKTLETNVKDSNLKQVMAEKAQEKEDIDSLFAPKKKW